MIYSKPSVSFEASASGFATGLTGTLAVRVTDGQTTVVVARTTAGITEFPAGSGIYGVTIIAPVDTGQFQVVWDDGTNFALEELTVTFTGSVDVTPSGIGVGMAFSALLTEFYARGFGYLDDGGAGVVRAKRWLNQSYQEICDMDDWGFLQSSVSSAAPFRILDLGVIESVKNTATGTVVEFVDRRTLDETFASLAAVGSAQYAYVSGGSSLNTYPVSTEVLKVSYLRTVADLVTNTDQPVMPSRYQYAIIDYACARAYMDSDNPEMAAASRRDGDALVAMMRERIMFPQHQNTEQITAYGYSTDAL